MIRIEVGQAVVEAQATEIRHATEDGVVPLYSVSDVLNATVRTLRAIGTEDAAAAIDRLTAEDGIVDPGGSELVHEGDAPGTFDGVRVPFPASPSGYVWLSPEALLQAAAVQLEGAAGLPDVLSLTLAKGARVGVVLGANNPRDYVIDDLVLGGPGVAVGEAGSDRLVESPVPGSVIAVLTPVPLPDWR